MSQDAPAAFASEQQTLDMLSNLIAKARKAGADAADAIFVNGVSLSHAQRLGKIEKLERSEGSDLGLRVLRRQAPGDRLLLRSRPPRHWTSWWNASSPWPGRCRTIPIAGSPIRTRFSEARFPISKSATP